MRDFLDCLRTVLVQWILVSFVFLVLLLFIGFNRPSSSLSSLRTSSAIRNVSHSQYQQAFDFLTTRRASWVEFNTTQVPQEGLRFKAGSVYQRFVTRISRNSVYDSQKDAALIEELLHSLTTSEVVNIRAAGDSGTQFKLILELRDGSMAVAKPMRMTREEEVPLGLYYFSEFERHYAEIAAFHLDRLLGLNRAAPCVGRSLNIMKEIRPFADEQIYMSTHQSPAGNVCFYGRCSLYCDPHHSYCGNPNSIEVSMCVYLPSTVWPIKFFENPWKRSYAARKAAAWQLAGNNATFCQNVTTNYSMRKLLDIIDAHVFDFLTGNMDRHVFEMFSSFGQESMMLLLDNAKGFGRSFDIMDILAPLYQCCKIRKSTFVKLDYLARAPVRLSSMMRYSLSQDPLDAQAPILADKYLRALDRRVLIVMETIKNSCFRNRNKSTAVNDVLIDDGF